MGARDNSVNIATVINIKKGKQGKRCIKSIETRFHSLQITKGGFLQTSQLSWDVTIR